jgi:stearoyl-CoA desaturase (delta-9 desaturase)
MVKHDLEDWKYYIVDIIKDKDLRFINKYYSIIAMSGLIIPAAINAIIYNSWYQFYVGIMVCGFFRVFLQQQVTWSINSVCHLWGKRNFNTQDQSKDNMLCAILAYGEGWHNGHHAFPGSARHGLLPYQVDISYATIKLLSYFHLAWDIKTPNNEQIESKKCKKVIYIINEGRIEKD